MSEENGVTLEEENTIKASGNSIPRRIYGVKR